jgi:hypothetical protein
MRNTIKLLLVAIVAAIGTEISAQLPQPVGSWSDRGAAFLSRSGSASVSLPDGRTLVLGGVDADGNATATVIAYDAIANSATSVGQLLSPRAGHSATVLNDGRVVVIGGRHDGPTINEIEIFDPASGTSQLAGHLSEPRTDLGSALLPDGTVLIVGGINTAGETLSSAEIFDPASANTTPVSSSMQQARSGASATTLIDGRVLVVGGRNGSQDLQSAEIFDPFTGGFALTDTSLSVARSNHTAILLQHNNGVLIVGGTSNGLPQVASDLFLPAQFPDPFSWGTGTFATTGNLNVPRSSAFGGATNDEGYAFVASGGAANAEVYRFATVKTDRDDYAPGERAVITGTGWQPGEAVKLLFQEDPAVHADYVIDRDSDGKPLIVADENGNIFWDQWSPERHDLGVRFYLLATGTQSRAQTTFTDAELVTAELTGVSNDVTVTQGSSANFTISLSATGNISSLITAASPSTARVKTAYALNGSGVLTSTSFSADFSFFSSGTGCTGGSTSNCDVTWTGAPTFYTVPASISADSLTPVGTYLLTLSEGAGTTATTNPSVSGGKLNDTTTTSITVHVIAPSNTAPVLASIGSKSVDELAPLTFTAAATDSDVPANALTFTLVSCAAGTFPTGATITTGGNFNWTPTEAQGPGTYCGKVVVTDNGTPNLADSEEVAITVNEVNLAPDLASIGSKSVDELAPLTFTATATDADVPANTLTFTLVSCAAGTFPTGATITTGGSFSWTPTEAQGPGTYCGKVVVTDDGTPNRSDSEEVSITVNEVNVAPDLASIGSKSVDELAPLTFTATATDADVPADTLTFTLVSCAAGTFPTGATITTGGNFSWTPTEVQGPGTYCGKVVVTDNGTPNRSDSEEVSITVNEVNLAPDLASIGSKSVDELAPLTFTATATDADVPADTLTFTLVSCAAGTFPAGSTITTGGGFSWTPTEAQGPGTYCGKVVVTDDGTPNRSDSEEISITVKEVNVAPVLTVPASFSTQWGVDPADKSATATDADIPANTLTFSKVGGPSWVAVASDGTISFSLIPASAIGANVVTVKVIDDGTPARYDQKSFTVTVTARPTQLTYDGKIAGQYSDQSTLSATLVDVGTGSTGTPIVGEVIAFTFNGGSAGSNTTNASGKASVLYTVTQAAPGPYTVSASYAGANGYSGAGPSSANFTVSKESATYDSVVFPGSIPVSLTSFQVSANVLELRVGGSEPNPNDGALPGDISKVTAITAKIVGISTNQQYTGSCGLGTLSGTLYASTQSFTCTFIGGPFVVDAYTLTLDIVANNYYMGSTFEDALSVWDPNAGFATGGGTFKLDGDRVSFGFSYTLQKGKTVPRSGFVVVRHLVDGGVCRVKSNNQMNAPAVNGNTVTLSGKGNYTCSDASGTTTASQGNITISAYAEDNGTSGTDQDNFWVSNAAAVTQNNLQMAGPAGTNASKLTGGNVQVPQPQR